MSRAESLTREGLEASLRVLGETNRLTLQFMQARAFASMFLREQPWSEVEPLYLRTLALQRAHLGPDDSETPKLLYGLGLGYSLNWQDAKAAPLLEPAVEQSRHFLGNENPQTAALLALLGYTRVHILQLEAAEPPARESLEITQRTLGEENTRTIGRMLVLARIHLMKGETNQADPLIEDVLAMKPRVEFENDPFIALHLSLLSMECLEQGNLPRAALLGELAEETLRLKPDSNPLASPRIITALGAVRLAQHRYTEAESLLRESLDLAERYWPEGEFRFLVMSLLGASLSGQKKYTAAEPFLIESCQGLQQRQASLPPYLNAPRRITESLERLVQLYDAWGKPAQATEWKQKLAAFQQAANAVGKQGTQP